MVKKITCLLFIFFHIQKIFSENEEKIIISLSDPFVYNQTNATLIIKNNFIFELYAYGEMENINFTIIDSDYENIEEYYIKNKQKAVSEEFDYILLSETYSSLNSIFIHIRLVNPYTDDVIFKKNYFLKLNIRINEKLTEIVSDLMTELTKINLKKNKSVKKINQKNEKQEKDKEIESNVIFTFQNYPKHELFIMNGFFKNTTNFFSILSFYGGYSYYPSDGFFLDFGFDGGIGVISDCFPITAQEFNDFFAGTFVGCHFFLKGEVEPNFGMRVELNYLSDKTLFFSIPIDVGLKIFINRKHVFRINTSFPFNSYDILKNEWSKKFTLGFMLGYGFKI